jgi:D-3-phosphoglycerate dehydrogenase
MTIDMETVEGHVSLRGTIAENNLVISRIDDYNRVYFILEGNLLVVEYEDRPGVLAVITKACADANINIEDIHAPQNAEQKRAIALLRTDKPVPAAIVSQLAAAINAKFAASIIL